MPISMPVGKASASWLRQRIALELCEGDVEAFAEREIMTHNSTTDWGWPAKILHWVGAVLILLLLVHGWWMTHITPRPERLANYAGHSAMGYDLLALLILRLLWRWLNPAPELPADLQRWEHIAARVSHAALYVLMFVVSLTGWVVATTFRNPMTKDLFGIDVPPIVTTVDRSVRQWLEESHMVLAYVLAAVVFIHIAAALRHHFLKRNDVLRRMIWSS
jgi:cytochrome b561